MEEERRGAYKSWSSRRGGDVRRKEWRRLSFMGYKEVAAGILPLGRREWEAKTGISILGQVKQNIPRS